MVMSDILLEINQRQWADPVYQSNVSEHYWVSQNITWVDDSAFVVQSEAPVFVEAVSKMMQHIIDVMAERGVALSKMQHTIDVWPRKNSHHHDIPRKRCRQI